MHERGLLLPTHLPALSAAHAGVNVANLVPSLFDSAHSLALDMRAWEQNRGGVSLRVVCALVIVLAVTSECTSSGRSGGRFEGRVLSARTLAVCTLRNRTLFRRHPRGCSHARWSGSSFACKPFALDGLFLQLRLSQKNVLRMDVHIHIDIDIDIHIHTHTHTHTRTRTATMV